MSAAKKFKGVIIVILVACLGCNPKEKLFTLLSPEETHVHFRNDITETDEFNINEYLYAFNGGGVGIGDFNKDGLPDIYFTGNQGTNKLYINNGNFEFDDITESAGVKGLEAEGNWATGVAIVDIDQNGWPDIYVNYVSDNRMFYGKNQLFVNNGDNTFTERASDYGLDLQGYSQQAVFFDYDMDGDLDMYQLNHSVHELDVYVKAENRTIRDSLAGDRLLRNDGGKYTDVSELAGIYGGATGYGLAIAVGDLNGNGCPDIYVSNDFHDNDYLYYNQCDGTFKEASETSMGHNSYFSMGSDVADLNNDRLLDIITLDMKPEDEILKKSASGPDSYDIYEFKKSFGFHDQYARNMLHLNRGNLLGKKAQFSEIGQMAGLDATDWSWSVLLADFDNDGLKDVHITNGILRRPNDMDYINYIYNTEAAKKMSPLELAMKMPSGEAKNYAYRNTGNLTFEDVSQQWGLDLLGYSMGAAYADLDADGDLDLIINNLNTPPSIYKNNAEHLTTNNYLKVAFKGNPKNIDGLGTRVEVHLKDEILTQELNPVRGWLSASEPVLHFGLGKTDTIPQIRVKWFDGRVQKLQRIVANQKLVLRYEEASLDNHRKKDSETWFEQITETGIDFNHRENNFTDFSIERLIPHKLSNHGPHITVADVNDDGKQDFFIGGAVGQPSAIYIQVQKGSEPQFVRLKDNPFEQDKAAEDIDAVFFDVDQDGDDDLYVVAGSGQSYPLETNQDRLYLNLGNGKFEKSRQLNFPASNGSCVVAGDFDKNGYPDLFIGSRSVPGSYGKTPESFIVWNDGKGNLTNNPDDSLLKSLGMVTDAVWDPKTEQLIVVGEWMPITFLSFTGKKIKTYEQPESSGWWNTIRAIDLDGDGDTDFLIGNLGENSELRAPVKLLVNDWDKNGSIDPLLVYQKQGKEWLYNGLDELKKQMPKIGVRYPNYASFAQDDLNQMFSKKDLENIPVKTADTFKSIQLRNLGSGNYEMKPLLRKVQTTPLYAFLADDFNSDGVMDVLAAGNFHGSSVSLGRFDASYGTLLTYKDGDQTIVPPSQSGFVVTEEVRDIQSIKIGKNEHWVLVGRNDEEVMVFRKNPNIDLNAPKPIRAKQRKD